METLAQKSCVLFQLSDPQGGTHDLSTNAIVTSWQESKSESPLCENGKHGGVLVSGMPDNLKQVTMLPGGMLI